MVLTRLVLPDDGGVNDTVVESSTVLHIQIRETHSHETPLYVFEAVFPTVDQSFVIPVEGVEPLVSIEHQ